MGDGHDEREDADGGTDSTGHPNSAPASVGRRSFLMGGLAGLVAGGVGSVVATQTLPNSLRVTKAGAPDGKAEFSVTVSGDLEPADDFEDPGSDSIDGDTATGIIGPESGTDTVRYSGDITSFSLDGPALVYRNGERVDPGTLGEDVVRLPQRLSVTKDGAPDGKAEFSVTVSGSLEPADDFEDPGSDSIDGTTATGIIGPEGGTDTVQYSGGITDFSLDGPAIVYRNGGRVDPDDLGRPGQVRRITPVGGEVTVAPRTEVMFEIAAPTLTGDALTTQWAIDGEDLVTQPGQPAWQDSYRGQKMDYIATDFTSTGTHDVRVTVYRGEREQERVFGSTTWTVHVEEGAGEAPRADRVSPEDREVEVPEDNTVAFTLRASDPDGDLHRVVWWEGVCDDVMKIDVVNGSEVRSSGTFDVEEECPFFAWVVDERGHRTTSESWRPVDERETDGPRHTLAVTKEGAPDGKARFSVTVSGDLEPADDFEDPGSDSIDGDTATGVIGPESGTDTVRYSGEITAFSLEGPAVVYLDGGRVDPETLG